MQRLETVKEQSRATFGSLLEKGKKQPDEVKAWGLAAGGAVVGALALAATAKSVVAVLATIASPPVAISVGAVGGGLLGWNYVHKYRSAGESGETFATMESPETEATIIPSITEEAMPNEPASPEAEPDQLELINGIGPVYAGRLRAAGIQSFGQLSELTPEEIHQMIGPGRSGNMIDVESWIAEASQLAARDTA